MFLVPNSVVTFFHRMASPPYFYGFTERLMPWLVGVFALLTAAGLYGGLYLAPADYQQGDSYRIIYIHVPSAWMSLFIYVVMAISGAIGLIWRIKL
ncbi:MAG: heme ABC transporter permease, partial [Methylococcaceae bacterium]